MTAHFPLPHLTMLELLVYMIKTEQVDIYDSILLPATLDLRQPVSYLVVTLESPGL